MQTKTNAEQILNEFDKKFLNDFVIAHKDGFTITGEFKNPDFKSGFMVGITNNNDKNLSVAIDRLFKTKEQFKGNNLFYGGWYDNESSSYYLDLSLFIKDLKTALEVAKAFNQKAIWSNAEQKTITV